ncbi:MULTISPECIES: hypothetical protein [unclassified Nostoc]|uniref:hypothetical protein n=1 Tax=unclassified Nostoc TaxID=2593658 RepID=UPI0013D88EB8|nr:MULTISPECIES: hypothetical protein [unclassified Nostoc]MBE9000673.1 hypothetical protein [Nostoc sp. LEGE 12447]NEU78178.1 hypothetical protein [Nostoc sp. UIC 10630]
MRKYRILKPDQSYTFTQYFLLPNPTIDVVAEFEYSYERTELKLPIYFAEVSYLEFLQNIQASQCQFKLIFARCNYASLRDPLIEKITSIL